MKRPAIDAIVVGSGPNGLAAAITMQAKGLQVLIMEEKDTIGGGMRSAHLTLPGFIHDCCSSVYPLAVQSVFFDTIPLETLGASFIYPPAFVAHPFTDGTAINLYTSLDKTISMLAEDDKSYKDLLKPLLTNWPSIREAYLAPLHFPGDPLKAMQFGSKGLLSVQNLSRKFHSKKMKAVLAGMAAHSMVPLGQLATSAFALIMLLMGHDKGWPIVRGGAQSLANALGKYFLSLGGEIHTGTKVKSLHDLPASRAVLLDLGPKEILNIASDKFSVLFRRQLERWHYGMGVFKIDWALSEPIPFSSTACRESATVHLGNSLEEIVTSEEQAWNGKISEDPFIILTQPSLFDQRAPDKKHTAWAYCHTPNGYSGSLTQVIEAQIERYAPGFRDCILARHESGPLDLENYNSNYVGGDINGGSLNLRQLFFRPVFGWGAFKSSIPNVYLCSASTPPGGGVHGLCGFFAAKKAMREIFHML